MYIVPFDMRCPDWSSASPADLYTAAVEARYREEHGAVAVVLSEHHHAEDGYCPRRWSSPRRSVEEAIAYVRQRRILGLQPLSGGLTPDLAWESLQLVAEKVIPATRG